MKKLILIILAIVVWLPMNGQTKRINAKDNITSLADNDEFLLYQAATGDDKNILWSAFKTEISSVATGLDFQTGAKYILGGQSSGNNITPTNKNIYVFGEASAFNYGGSGEILGIGENILGGATGRYLQAFGTNSQQYTTGNYNFAGGYYSARSLTGSYCNVLGPNAGQNASGNYLNLFGASAGSSCTGSYNDLFGSAAGFSITGSYNYGAGVNSMYLAEGSYSIGIGYLNLYNNDGNYNGAFGYNVLSGVTGSAPSFSYQNLNGSNNWAFGRNIYYLTDSTLNTTFTVAFNDTLSQDSTVYFSDDFKYFGIGTKTPTARLEVNGDVIVGDDISPSLNLGDENTYFRVVTTNTIALGVNSSQVFRADASNVRIGTVNYAPMLKVGAGAASTPNYSFYSDANTGIYRIGSDNLGISTNGTNRVDISNSTTKITNDFEQYESATNYTKTYIGEATVSDSDDSLEVVSFTIPDDAVCMIEIRTLYLNETSGSSAEGTWLSDAAEGVMSNANGTLTRTGFGSIYGTRGTFGQGNPYTDYSGTTFIAGWYHSTASTDAGRVTIEVKVIYLDGDY